LTFGGGQVIFINYLNTRDWNPGAAIPSVRLAAGGIVNAGVCVGGHDMGSSKPWLKWLGIGCGGGLVLLAVFVAVLFFSVRTLTSGPEEVVQQFLARAAAGDYVGAHALFAVPLQEQQPLELFTATVKATPSLFAIADSSFNERSIDIAGAKLAGTVTLKAGTRVPASFGLVKENDSWRILSYHIGSKE
jgi:hypothetical protein